MGESGKRKQMQLANKAIIAGNRIILYYPGILPKDKAKLFLDREEKALKRLEELLQMRYEGYVKVFIQISPFSKCWLGSDGIHYSFPLPELQQIFVKKDILIGIGELHELTHFISQKLLSPSRYTEPPAFFLTEGLATAIDALVSPHYAVHLHLVAKGLLQLRCLKPITQIAAVDFPTFRYEETGSFTLFLLEQYGMGKVKKLYTSITINNKKFEWDVKRIYGKSLITLEQEWHRFLSTFLSGQNERSQYIASASLELSQLYNTLDIIKYGELWFSRGFISHIPNRVYEQERALYNAYFALTRNLSSRRLRQEYKIFQAALKDYYAILEKWQEAAQIFKKVKQFIAYHANYDLILTALKRAHTLFQAVDDVNMMSKISHYITTLELLKEAKKALNMKDYIRAKKLMRKANKVVAQNSCAFQGG